MTVTTIAALSCVFFACKSDIEKCKEDQDMKACQSAAEKCMENPDYSKECRAIKRAVNRLNNL